MECWTPGCGAPDSRLPSPSSWLLPLDYRLAWDDEFDPKVDARYEHDGVSLVTRKKLALHLDGTKVDYQVGPMGGGFTVENPNYPNTGGCPGCHGGA